MDGLNLGYSLAGGFVGFLVGLTGVGGGSLMAPLLILMFGFSPAVAVGTDLWFATITKTTGGLIHHRLGSADWKLVGRLCLGSIPAAILTLLWLGFYHHGRLESQLLMLLLGGALLVTSVLMVLRPYLNHPLHNLRLKLSPQLPRLRKRQYTFTVLGAAIIGALVTLTSVGAGALVAVMLAILYPLRLGTKKIVGTDIIHAVPLTLVAAIGHSWLGNVDAWLLASLLLGSIPGIIAGSLVTGKVNENLVRYALAGMLIVSALKMIFS
ncbi:TSUP family transporter [Altererythrobacter salegens]|uniref:Probable membrane transporter protein n=2 Tax=Croceibacterium salegens TaxID=1737568 RepID=A0A6I4SUH0_9SPHN|nr:TSUP family transporter [Croceibacterium salegens]